MQPKGRRGASGDPGVPPFSFVTLLSDPHGCDCQRSVHSAATHTTSTIVSIASA